MHNASYQLLVFDWDGTLIDSTAKIAACLRDAATEAGAVVHIEDQYRYVIGLGLREAFLHLYPAASEVVIQKMMGNYRRHYLYENKIQVDLFQGVEGMLQTLIERGHQLAIATGKNREGLDRVMREMGLGHYFRVTRCASETASKPDSRMLHEILRESRMAANSALMIGDTTFDLEMAQRAGMRSVAVRSGAHSAGQLQSWSPLTILDDITHLVSWLDGKKSYNERGESIEYEQR